MTVVLPLSAGRMRMLGLVQREQSADFLELERLGLLWEGGLKFGIRDVS